MTEKKKEDGFHKGKFNPRLATGPGCVKVSAVEKKPKDEKEE